MAHSGNTGRAIQEQVEQGSPNLKYWRSWGSWYSWGSATGLGLFLVLASFATWILFHL